MRALLNFMRDYWSIIWPFTCNHVWEYDQSNPAKRTCSHCERHEWMFTLKYPSETEPSIQWKEMPRHAPPSR